MLRKPACLFLTSQTKEEKNREGKESKQKTIVPIVLYSECFDYFGTLPPRSFSTNRAQLLYGQAFADLSIRMTVGGNIRQASLSLQPKPVSRCQIYPESAMQLLDEWRSMHVWVRRAFLGLLTWRCWCLLFGGRHIARWRQAIGSEASKSQTT